MQDIKLFVNSPGGSVTAGMGIYDAIQVFQILHSILHPELAVPFNATNSYEIKTSAFANAAESGES